VPAWRQATGSDINQDHLAINLLAQRWANCGPHAAHESILCAG